MIGRWGFIGRSNLRNRINLDRVYLFLFILSLSGFNVDVGVIFLEDRDAFMADLHELCNALLRASAQA